MLTEQALTEFLAAFPRLSMAVVGDLFLDKYLDLDSRLTETSIETGLDAYQISGIRCYPGAGGTVLNNLRALGVGKLRAVSVVGDDGEGYELLRALQLKQVATEDVLVSPERMTPTYTKPMLSQPDGGARELNRLDIKNRKPQSAELDRRVIERLARVVDEVDAIIVADQVSERNLGVVTDAVRAALSDLAEKNPRLKVFADSRSHIGMFHHCTVKPNQHELAHALGRPELGTAAPSPATRQAVIAAAGELSRRTGRGVFATQGPDGILYIEGDRSQHIPGVPVTGPIDICGAGDSTMAGIVAATCAGASPAQAARVGCLVASLTIQQIGVTGSATRAQVLARFREAQ